MESYCNYINVNGNILTISNISTNEKWNLKVDGNIALSKYHGNRPTTINILYSSITPYAKIYFSLTSNDCIIDKCYVTFPSEGYKTYNFDIFPSEIALNNNDLYIITGTSQYGIYLTCDNSDIILSTTFLPIGQNTFSIYGNGTTNINGYIIATEKNTNLIKTIHVTRPLISTSYLNVYNQFGIKIQNNEVLSWKDYSTFVTIDSSSYITSISNLSNFTIISSNNKYIITPNDLTKAVSESVTIINAEGLTITFTLQYQLSVQGSFNMYKTVNGQNINFYYDYYNNKLLNNGYFDTNGNLITDINQFINNNEAYYS